MPMRNPARSHDKRLLPQLAVALGVILCLYPFCGFDFVGHVGVQRSPSLCAKGSAVRRLLTSSTASRARGFGSPSSTQVRGQNSREPDKRRPSSSEPEIVDAEVTKIASVPDDDYDEKFEDAPSDEQDEANNLRSFPFTAVIAGGGLAGLWLASQLATGLGSQARLRIYDPTLKRGADNKWQQAAGARDKPQAVVLPGYLWSRLPNHVQSKIFTEGGFAEQWPEPPPGGMGGTLQDAAGSQSSNAFPRTVPLGALEDALLAIVQDESFASSIEIRSTAYNEAEHERIVREEPFHVVVACDGEDAQRTRDNALRERFGRAVPRSRSLGPVDTLAVAFDLRNAGEGVKPLSLAACTAFSLSQRRYWLSWTGADTGLMQIHLTVGEAAEVSEASDGGADGDMLSKLQSRCTGTWSQVLEGLRLYGIPESAASSASHQHGGSREWPFFCAVLEGLETPAKGGLPLGFLIGDAARAGDFARIGLGQGLGMSAEGAQSLADLLIDAEAADKLSEGTSPSPDDVGQHAAFMASLRDREHEPQGISTADRIAVGLERGRDRDAAGMQNDLDGFVRTLEATLAALQRGGRLPPARIAELPTAETLRNHIVAAGLQPATLGALASSGPSWNMDRVQKAGSTSSEGGEMLDFGGETQEGLAQAAELERAGDAGDSEAQFQLGVMFFTANGVAKDEAAALKWLMRAAEADHSQAQNCVGYMLRNGLAGIAADKGQAAYWLTKGAEGGDPEAQFSLAEMYEEGDGLTQDSRQALKWFEKAAVKGLAQAQFKVGIMLLEGDGVEQDKTRSVAWIKLAADQGLPEALYMLGVWNYSGDGMPVDKAKAAKYFTEAAEKGDALAQCNIGVMLELGDGVDQNVELAQRWLREAAAQGVAEAHARLRE